VPGVRVLVVLLLPALVLPALLPTVAGQGYGIDNPDAAANVTLFAHLIGRQDMPMNTQEPPATWSYTAGDGVVAHSQGCVDVPGLGLVSNTHHTVYGYAAPTVVDYKGGSPEATTQRGIHADLVFETSRPLTLNWYLEPEWLPLADADAPTVVPQVTVLATVRQGDAVSVNHVAMDSGPILAMGSTGPADFAGPATDHPDVAYDGVYGVRVSLPFAQGAAMVGQDIGFNLRVDVFVTVPGCADPGSDAYAMPDWLRHHSSDGHRPRLDFTITQPVQVRSVLTRIVNGTLVAQALLDTPWGPYNLGDVALSIAGPSPPRALLQTEHEAEPYENFVGRRVAWTWDFTAENAQRGDYTLAVTAYDAQGAGPATATLPFRFGGDSTTCRVEDGGEALCHTVASSKGSPTLAPALIVLALAALALRRRGQ